MDPVGQNRPIVLPDPGSRPIEFLLRVLDLSKGGVAGASVAATFTPSLLERALAAEGVGPLRFLPLPPPLSRPLLRVLSSPDLSSGAPRIKLLVTRHENSLEWTFSGKDLQTTFRSDLLQSRSGAVALQPWTEPSPTTSSPVFSDGRTPLQGPDGWLSGTLSSLSEESVSGDRVFGAGTLRGTVGAGGVKGSGPVMAWPAFIPGQTIEFSVRWVSAEEAEGESKALGQGGRGDIVFTLDIPWADPEGSGQSKSVRLMGRYQREGTLALSASALPESFRHHLLARRGILEESLRTFPGVALRLMLPGADEGGRKG